MAGAAGADLVHLLAELLDNAAACSPPATPIVVTAAGDGDGHRIEVADRGFGMTDQELAWANQRLDGAPDPAGPAELTRRPARRRGAILRRDLVAWLIDLT